MYACSLETPGNVDWVGVEIMNANAVVIKLLQFDSTMSLLYGSISRSSHQLPQTIPIGINKYVTKRVATTEHEIRRPQCSNTTLSRQTERSHGWLGTKSRGAGAVAEARGQRSTGV